MRPYWRIFETFRIAYNRAHNRPNAKECSRTSPVGFVRARFCSHLLFLMICLTRLIVSKKYPLAWLISLACGIFKIPSCFCNASAKRDNLDILQ